MINHLWQSTIFALAIAVLAATLRKNRASIRHWLWFAASIKFLIPLALLMNLSQQMRPSTPPLMRPVTIAAGQLTSPFPEPLAFTAAVRPESFDWMPWLLAAWAIGFLAIAFMRLRAWLRIRALIRTSTPAALSLPVEARYTTGLLGPGIVGILRPVLLLPDGIQQHLTPEQFHTAIAHELTHVRRRDNLYAAIHMCVEAIFWFHPLVWWIGTRLVEERELACDEAVLAQGGNPRDYAEAILGVCKHYVEPPVACVSGVTGADIKKRLEAILTPRNILGLDWTRKLLLTTTALVAAMIPFLAGIATAQSHRFEVASIKPSAPGQDSFTYDITPEGRFTSRNMTVHDLIRFAYGLKELQLTSGPSWITSGGFDIQAQPAEPVSREQALLMIQSLLADRFQLKFHRETREQPGYAMRLAKVDTQLRPPISGRSKLMLGDIDAVDITMKTLGAMMEFELERPVVDQTGLDAGPHSLKLRWASDHIPADATSGKPSLFTALQEQLGLKLESVRVPLEIFVIDSIERPSEN